MIIDFHTHIFPDKIASKTIDYLSVKGGTKAYGDGSENGLLQSMDEAGVTCAIALPVLTKPSQFDSVNRFALEVNERHAVDKKILSFGGIHPQCEDLDGKMKFLKKCGFKGVKIHPDYQDEFIDSENYVRILQCAKEYDLIVVTHAGVDIAYPDCVHCSPDRVRKVIEKVNHKKFVLAHMGASEQFDAVYDSLCGLDVYFDTAYVLGSISKQTFLRLANAHGMDKILFATDSPWQNIKDCKDKLVSFGIEKQDLDKIFYKNALSLLGVEEV